MPQEVALHSQETESVRSSPAWTALPMRRRDIVTRRRLPTESTGILVSSSSARPRNRKRNVSFSAELLLESSVRDGDLHETRKLLQSVSGDCLDQPCANSGITVLHQSVLNSDADMTQLLLNARANIESRDVDGWTPLQAAAAMCADSCVKILLDAGADPYAKTLDSQETALDLVHVYDQASVRCVKYLVSAMQRINASCPRMRDSLASLSSISTCSSFASNISSLSSSTSGSCPSPVQLIGALRSRSQDSGIDCSSSAVATKAAGSPNSPAPSPLCPARPRRSCVIDESSTALSPRATSASAISAASCNSQPCYNNRAEQTPSAALQCCTPAGDSDSDTDPEFEGCGSVLASWRDNTAISPTEHQSTSTPFGQQFACSDVTNDVGMIICSGSVAQRKRRDRMTSSQGSVSGQQTETPRRRLSFV